MTITTVAEILADRGVHLYIHPSHNVPGDTTAHERLDAAIAEYQRKVKVLVTKDIPIIISSNHHL